MGSLGTHNALGLAKDKKAAFLLASTSECYGDPLVHPQREDYWVPIFLQDLDGGLTSYGFPDTGDGVKVALHHYGANVDPDTLHRTVSHEEIAFMRALLARYMPDVNGPLRAATACMYTNVPDNHFVIDWHPAHRNVVVASPCSGHGFKFASALGEVLASMVVGATVSFDTSLFSLDRFRVRR